MPRAVSGGCDAVLLEVVFVLLVTAVGTSLFEAAARLAQEPLKVQLP